jgi:hypothetical protein
VVVYQQRQKPCLCPVSLGLRNVEPALDFFFEVVVAVVYKEPRVVDVFVGEELRLESSRRKPRSENASHVKP